MKCVFEEGITLDVVKDDLSCEDLIDQTLGAVGREVSSLLLSFSLSL